MKPNLVICAFEQYHGPAGLTRKNQLAGGALRTEHARAIQVFADGGDLGEAGAVVEFQRRRLARRVHLEVRLAAVLGAHQVDFDAFQVQALLGHEHLHHPRIGADRRVELHPRSSLFSKS